MIIIKKNLWLAFYCIAVFWSLLTAAAAYYTYQNVYHDISLEQKNITKISANSLGSTFKQYETILHIVAEELIRDDSADDKDAIYSILSSAVNMDKTILAFGVFNVKGEPVVSAPSLPNPNKESLLSESQTQETFLETLKATDVVLGRTYFSEALGQVILPFRKAVRNTEGKTLFVLSLAVSLKQGFDYFINSVQESQVYDTYLYRENDRYFQLAPIKQIYDKDIYNYQIPLKAVNQSVAQLIESTGQSYELIKSKGGIVYNELRHPSRQSMTASVYLNHYNLWLTTEIKFKVFNQLFIKKVTILLILYVLSLFIMFLLFRNIALNEENKNTALIYQATHDYLTGLYNRFYLEQYLANFTKDEVFTLIYVDIDNFRSVNESYGHNQGDMVLKEVAQRLNKVVSEDELLVRTSSDEFTVVSHESNRQQIEELCDRIAQTFADAFQSGGVEVALSTSIAVSSAPEDGATIALIKRNVDLAMYAAKKSKNCVYYYQHELLTQYLYKNDVENELKKALEKNEFHLVYQPQLGSNNNLKGVEALLRWNNSKLGNIPPDIFIPIAENAGYMNTIGEFVMQRALADVYELKESTGKQFDLSINVSVKQLQSSDFYALISALLERYKLDASTVLLEVTESVLIDDIDRVRAIIIKLKEKKLRISLDDFGTGYSSLNILKNLPIDELKIDKSFVSDMDLDEKAFSMVQGIIAISQKLKMVTVAEGIETVEVKNTLQSLGCDIYQGYYFSRPLNKENLKKYLLEQ
jgi:diguanylate cyclase (GGDEF)-like protein